MEDDTKAGQPLTDWIAMENGLRYRWIRLSREEISALRKQAQYRRENIQLLNGKQGTSAP
jgi:hypothetical protein